MQGAQRPCRGYFLSDHLSRRRKPHRQMARSAGALDSLQTAWAQPDAKASLAVWTRGPPFLTVYQEDALASLVLGIRAGGVPEKSLSLTLPPQAIPLSPPERTARKPCRQMSRRLGTPVPFLAELSRSRGSGVGGLDKRSARWEEGKALCPFLVRW
ncbi:MAG: hypothetical protein J2P37_13485 [Ktedonobacteraceae bacterium]|nr:hypothetical protein [Ktedonobacteraceae bacterium]